MAFPKVLVATAICEYSQYTTEFLPKVLSGIEHVKHVVVAYDGIKPPTDQSFASEYGQNATALPLEPYKDQKSDPDRRYRLARMREALRQYFLEGKWDYLYFHDADVIPPKNILETLVSMQRPIASGLYCHKNSPVPVFPELPLNPVPSELIDRDGYKLTQISRIAPYSESRAFGMGCMLISREALAETPFDQENLNREGYHGEDYAWCDDASVRGFGPVSTHMDANCYHVDKHGVAVIAHFGGLEAAAVWNGPGYQASNQWGLWFAGVPRFDLTTQCLDSLGPEYSKGIGLVTTAETCPVGEALECYKYLPTATTPETNDSKDSSDQPKESASSSKSSEKEDPTPAT